MLFKKIAVFLRSTVVKVAKNGDHNIDPRSDFQFKRSDIFGRGHNIGPRMSGIWG
jgi:hypothetical protein